MTHGVLQAELLVIDQDFHHVWEKPVKVETENSSTSLNKTDDKKIIEPQKKKIVWWLILLVISLFFGSYFSAKLSGQAKLLRRPPEQTIIAFFGGFLVGTGAAFATGCVVGNIMSGWALMSAGLFVFGIMTVLSNWAVTYFYLMGGKPRDIFN